MLIRKSRLHSWSSRTRLERAETDEVETDGVGMEEVVVDLEAVVVDMEEEVVVVDVVGGNSYYIIIIFFKDINIVIKSSMIRYST